MAGTAANINAVLQGPTPPYTDGEAVTLTGAGGADWTPTKAVQTRALWVGGAGAVKVDFAGGGTGVSLGAVPAGTELKISVTKVYNTADGTAATLITALY